jgi:hypothetical protein
MPEQTFLPARDSRMSGAPEIAHSINYGSSTAVRHVVLYSGENKSSWDRTIVEFNVVELTGAQIIDAKLVREYRRSLAERIRRSSLAARGRARGSKAK